MKRETWAEAVARHAAMPWPNRREKARMLAFVTGRPFETCLTALRRYARGKTPRQNAKPCARCAQIRRILHEQHTEN